MTTWNSADKSARIALSNGDLTATADGTANHQAVRATAFKSSGKWYCEITVDSDAGAVGTTPRLGISDSSFSVDNSVGESGTGNSYGYLRDGTKKSNGTGSSYGATYTTGDVISILLDMDAGTLTFWKNGTTQGEAYNSLSGSFAVTFSDVGASVVTANFGGSSFTYTPPEGYSGFDIPPPGPASGVAFFQAMTAEGFAPATGSASFEPMTASASGPPFGEAAFEPMTATGVAAPAPYGEAAFEPMTAEGESSAASTAAGDAEFEPMSATGAATGATVAHGDASFEPLSAAGFTNDFGEAAFEPMVAQAHGLTGGVANGDARFEAFDVAAESVGGSVAQGDAYFRQLTVAAVAVQPTVAHGVAAFLQLRAQAQGLTGGVASAAPAFEPLSALAEGHQPTVAAGAAEFERMVAWGQASPLLSGGFRTWVTNIANDAITEYQAHDFNSYASFGGKYWAAGPGGIYRLEGIDDDGTAIAWTLRTGMVTSKDGTLKRLEELLMAARFDGPIRVRVWTDDTTYFDYNVTNHRADAVHQVRAKLGKGLRSRFYRVQLFGLDNAHVELSRMDMPLVELRRRLG